MTYKTLVDWLEAKITGHKLVNQYNFGNLSDIETPENGSPNYPYAFLRPDDITIGAHANEFSFELILMDYVFDITYSQVEGTSRMLQILSDIIQEIRSNDNRDIDIELTVTATPFKERFKDSVVGVNAIINIQTAEPLDGCNDIFA
jgi:hypothetical protein